jgi:hypothetical protein
VPGINQTCMGCKGERVRIPPRRPFYSNEINGLQFHRCSPFFFGSESVTLSVTLFQMLDAGIGAWIVGLRAKKV